MYPSTLIHLTCMKSDDVCIQASQCLKIIMFVGYLVISGCSGSTLDDMDPRHLSVDAVDTVQKDMNSDGMTHHYDQVVINEINAQSAPHDWVEIANLGDAPVDLTGCFISDEIAQPQKSIFTTSMHVIIPAKGYVVISVTDETLGFKLGKEDVILLATPEGEIIDQHQYTSIESQARETMSRIPDLTGAMMPSIATPGVANQEYTPATDNEQNVMASQLDSGTNDRSENDIEPHEETRDGASTHDEVSTPADSDTPIDDDPSSSMMTQTDFASAEIEPSLVINEVAAKGEPEDWIELYNIGASPVSLEGLQMTDNLETEDFFVFDDHWGDLGVGELVVIEISEETVGFKLGKDEAFYLLDHEGTLIDFVDWEEGDSPEGGSLARYPDGEGDFSTNVQHSRGILNQ